MTAITFVNEDGSLRGFDPNQDTDILIEELSQYGEVLEYEFDNYPRFVKIRDHYGYLLLVVAASWGFEFGVDTGAKKIDEDVLYNIALLLRDYLDLPYGQKLD